MDCGKLDIQNVALKAPKKAKRNSSNIGFFTTFILGNISKNKDIKNSKDLREEYARIMEEYKYTKEECTKEHNNHENSKN